MFYCLVEFAQGPDHLRVFCVRLAGIIGLNDPELSDTFGVYETGKKPLLRAVRKSLL
jgi:hypothetical protein